MKFSIACVRNRYGLLSVQHASGGTFEERTDKHLSRVSDTRHKVNKLVSIDVCKLMESRSYPYDCVDLSDILDRKFTLDIVNKITPKWSEAMRRARIPNQY